MNFITIAAENDFKYFVNTLAQKFKIDIAVEHEKIVKSLGSDETIVDSLKVRFIPSHCKTAYVEDEIAASIHKYVFEKDIGLIKEMGIEKDVHNDEIRYSFVYTYAGDYHNCEDCKRLCKRGIRRCLYFAEE